MILCSEIFIRNEADVALARHSAGETATRLGFSGQRRAEVRLIASELAHNHLDHKTFRGMIRISGQLYDQVPVLTICSLDKGPGISNVTDVLQGPQGGYRSLTGLGTGLASVSRLANLFSCCSGTDLKCNCSAILGRQWKGTVITARCWPREQAPFYFDRDDNMDIAALVCGRSETSPCGDGIFINSDSRFTRIVLVDSPGKGRGGGETELIGQMVAKFDLIWPPDHVIESLADVFAAEPATSVFVLRFDQLLGELRCCRTGNVDIHLLVDGRPAALPGQLAVEGGHMIRGTDTVYKVSDTVSCLLHSDGVTIFSRQQIQSLLIELQAAEESVTGISRFDHALLAQILFSRNRQPYDDAALCLWSWQRKK
jgi:anti-sigma regulatory factor (Ser/Thr protein kinase)